METIRVHVRFRPAPSDTSSGHHGPWKSTRDERVLGAVNYTATSANVHLHGVRHHFSGFHRVHGVLASQEEVFDSVGREAVTSFTAGVTVALLAYGQARSGRSFTMFGDGDTVSNAGLVFRAARQLFDFISSKDTHTEYSVSVSCICICGGAVHDLLN